MKEIKLTKGQVAQVDDEDYEWLNAQSWHARWALDGQYYAYGGEGNSFPMARVIMDTPKGFVCDHIDGIKLNNQRYNLRNITQKENCNNQHPWLNGRQKKIMNRLRGYGKTEIELELMFRAMSDREVVELYESIKW